MEYIYIAKSKSFPGMVKIGRTDYAVDRRMDQLSDQDYGPSDFDGDSEWEAVKVFVVEDNEKAERILHNHFADIRVEGRSELFFTDDPDSLSQEAIQVVNGTYLVDTIDSFDILIDIAQGISLVSGINLFVQAFFPNEKSVSFMERKEDLIENLDSKGNNSNSIFGKIFYKGTSTVLSITTTFGMLAAIPFIAMGEGAKEAYKDGKKIFEDYKNKNL